MGEITRKNNQEKNRRTKKKNIVKPQSPVTIQTFTSILRSSAPILHHVHPPVQGVATLQPIFSCINFPISLRGPTMPPTNAVCQFIHWSYCIMGDNTTQQEQLLTLPPGARLGEVPYTQQLHCLLPRKGKMIMGPEFN